VRWVPSTNIGGAERVAANMIRKRS
jgi:hypothetical protein